MFGLFLTADLLFSSKILGVASARGWTLSMVRSEQELLQRAAESASDLSLVLLDLTFPGLDVQELVKQIRQQDPMPKAIVAFGPHVRADLLGAAEQAGCSEVLTNGQLSSRAEQVLETYFA
jgi:CheY-like chemotaxis protein